MTRAIIDTIREPLIVLDDELRVVVASRSFYERFGVTQKLIGEQLFHRLGSGEWDIPGLKALLEQVIPEHRAVENYEVVHEFPRLGQRTMLINAREIEYKHGRRKMLVSIFDVSENRLAESALHTAIEQRNILLKEMRHRIANSLQLIASILMLKAGSVSTEEARKHLEDTHERIMSIATVQRQLEPGGTDDHIELKQYLETLCASLARSMIGGKPIQLIVDAGPGTVNSDDAISIGLLTTELVINSLKYAFPGGTGIVTVKFRSDAEGWTFDVIDNGVGYVQREDINPRGLGSSIVDSIAFQLKAVLHRDSSPKGTAVSLVFKEQK